MNRERGSPTRSPTIRRHRSLVGAACLLFALGCQPAPKAESSAARAGLIGKTKQALLACAQAPLSEAHRGQETVLVYHRAAPAFDQSFFGSKSSVGSVHHECTAILTLKDDRVVAAEYRSEPPSIMADDHCEEIFRGCLP